jgi:hypothetical protein
MDERPLRRRYSVRKVAVEGDVSTREALSAVTISVLRSRSMYRFPKRSFHRKQSWFVVLLKKKEKKKLSRELLASSAAVTMPAEDRDHFKWKVSYHLSQVAFEADLDLFLAHIHRIKKA